MKNFLFKTCFVIVLHCLLFIGCKSNGISQSKTTDDKKPSISSDSSSSPNSENSPNISKITALDPVNCVYYDAPYIIKNSLYYINHTDNNKLYSIMLSDLDSQIDSAKSKKISDDSIFSLTSDSNNIYYANSSNIGLNKISLDGTGKIKISNNLCSNLYMYMNSIFYINKQDNNTIYSYSLSQNSSSKITQSSALAYAVCGDSIIYINKDDNYTLYSIYNTGEQNTKLTDSPITSFAICNNKLYFNSSNDNNYIYTSNLDGSQSSKLSNYPCNSLSCDKSYLYFLKSDDFNKLYRITFDGKNLTKLSNEIPSSYSLVDKYIFVNKLTDKTTLVLPNPNAPSNIIPSNNEQ